MRTLWMVGKLTVSVDETTNSWSMVRTGETVELPFTHNGSPATLAITLETPKQPCRIEYSLSVGDELEERATIRTGDWRFALITFPAAIGFAVAPFAFKPSDIPLSVILYCIAASFSCSLITIRLLSGDLSSFLVPQQVRNGIPQETKKHD